MKRYSSFNKNLSWVIKSLAFVMQKKQTDNSDLWVVGGLLYDLRCHPERRADERVSLYLGVRQLARHSKVCQLHFAVLGQEHVGSWGPQTQSAGTIKRPARERLHFHRSLTEDQIHSKGLRHEDIDALKSNGPCSEIIIFMNYTMKCLIMDYIIILFALCNIMLLYPPR